MSRPQRLSVIEWIVHAVTCAKRNLKLRRDLQRRGFVIRQFEGAGEAYHYVDFVRPKWNETGAFQPRACSMAIRIGFTECLPLRRIFQRLL